MGRTVPLLLEDEDGKPVDAYTHFPTIRENSLDGPSTREGMPHHRLKDESSSLNSNPDGTYTVVQTGQTLRKRR